MPFSWLLRLELFDFAVREPVALRRVGDGSLSQGVRKSAVFEKNALVPELSLSSVLGSLDAGLRAVLPPVRPPTGSDGMGRRGKLELDELDLEPLTCAEDERRGAVLLDELPKGFHHESAAVAWTARPRVRARPTIGRAARCSRTITRRPPFVLRCWTVRSRGETGSLKGAGSFPEICGRVKSKGRSR